MKSVRDDETGRFERESREDLQSLRPYLFGLAYRMLGRVHDAEDVVQEACLAFLASKGQEKEIVSLRRYLAKITIRLCLAHRKFQSQDQAEYIGPWLPEPLVTGPCADPTFWMEIKDGLSLAFLRLLERLSPLERAAFLLYEIFGWSYPEIAEALERSEAACRQIVHRAKENLPMSPRYKVTWEEQQDAVSAFLVACNLGDPKALIGLFTEKIRVLSDGGGKVKAARREITGADKAARFFLGLTRKMEPSIHIDLQEINGALGLRMLSGTAVVGAILFVVEERQIAEIDIVLNPEKLGFLGGSA